MDARIWLTGDDGEPRSVPINGERTVIGRDPESDLHIDDEAVSWNHLVIESSGGASGETVGDPIAVGRHPVAVAVGREAVWVGDNGDGTVTRIEP